MLFAVLFALCVFASAGAASVQWKGAQGASWHLASNWDPEQVPGAADDAVIGSASAVTLSEAVDVGSLTLRNYVSLTNVASNVARYPIRCSRFAWLDLSIPNVATTLTGISLSAAKLRVTLPASGAARLHLGGSAALDAGGSIAFDGGPSADLHISAVKDPRGTSQGPGAAARLTVNDGVSLDWVPSAHLRLANVSLLVSAAGSLSVPASSSVTVLGDAAGVSTLVEGSVVVNRGASFFTSSPGIEVAETASFTGGGSVTIAGSGSGHDSSTDASVFGGSRWEVALTVLRSAFPGEQSYSWGLTLYTPLSFPLGLTLGYSGRVTVTGSERRWLNCSLLELLPGARFSARGMRVRVDELRLTFGGQPAGQDTDISIPGLRLNLTEPGQLLNVSALLGPWGSGGRLVDDLASAEGGEHAAIVVETPAYFLLRVRNPEQASDPRFGFEVRLQRVLLRRGLDLVVPTPLSLVLSPPAGATMRLASFVWVQARAALAFASPDDPSLQSTLEVADVVKVEKFGALSLDARCVHVLPSASVDVAEGGRVIVGVGWVGENARETDFTLHRGAIWRGSLEALGDDARSPRITMTVVGDRELPLVRCHCNANLIVSEGGFLLADSLILRGPNVVTGSVFATALRLSVGTGQDITLDGPFIEIGDGKRLTLEVAGTGTVRLLGFAALSALRGCQLVISSSDPQGVGSELRLIGGTFTLDEGVDMYVPENLRLYLLSSSVTLRGSVYLLRQSLLSTRRLSQSAGSVVLAGTVQLSSPDCRIELHAGGASSIGDSSDSDSDDSSHCSGGVQGQGQAHGQGARQARQGPTGVTLLARGATVTYGNGEFVLYGRVQIEQGVEVTDYATTVQLFNAQVTASSPVSFGGLRVADGSTLTFTQSSPDAAPTTVSTLTLGRGGRLNASLALAAVTARKLVLDLAVRPTGEAPLALDGVAIGGIESLTTQGSADNTPLATVQFSRAASLTTADPSSVSLKGKLLFAAADASNCSITLGPGTAVYTDGSAQRVAVCLHVASGVRLPPSLDLAPPAVCRPPQPPPTPTSSSGGGGGGGDDGPGSGLKTGAILGIVFGCVGGVAVVAGLCLLRLRRSRSQPRFGEDGSGNVFVKLQ